MAAVRGLGEAQPGVAPRTAGAVEEAARQRDVVVDDEHPVERLEVAAVEQRVEVLELAARPGARDGDLDLVARAAQLGLGLRPQARDVVALDARGRGRAGAGRRRRAAQPAPAGGGARVVQAVQRGEQRAAPAADGAGRAGEEVVDAGRRGGGRRAQRRLHPAERVGGQHGAVRAAVARAVQRAAGEHAQLARQRRARALRDVLAAGGSPARACGAAERAQARVVAGAAVVERGGGDVADAPAGGPQARLPLLLVAVERQRGVERADALERAAAHRHVRAPGVRGVAVGGAEVEVRDRRALAAADAEAVVLEAREHRAGEDADVVRLAASAVEQRARASRASPRRRRRRSRRAPPSWRRGPCCARR